MLRTLVRLAGPVLLATSCSLFLDFDDLKGGAGSGGSGGGGEAGTGGNGGVGATGGSGGDAGVGTGGSEPGGSGGAGGSGGTSGSGAGGGGGGETGVPLDELAGTLATALCEKMAACYSPAILDILFADEECELSLERVLDNTVVASIGSSIDVGALEYRATGIPDCVDEFESLACEDVTIAFPEACKEALAGSKPRNEACAHSLECEPGLYCNISSCPGTCQPPLAEDDVCTELDTCAPGLTCFDGACAALGLAQDECGAGLHPDCATGNVCLGAKEANDAQGTPAEPGTCVTAADLFVLSQGQPCSYADTPALCRRGFSCPIALNATCQATVESGGACQLAVPDMCPEGEYCSAGVCTALPGAQQSCAFSLVKPGCKAYLRCVSGTCRPLGNNDAPCGSPDECYSGYCSEDGFCAPPQCL